MSKFEPKTFPDFVKNMSARVVSRTKLNDLEDGSVLLTIISGLARQLDDLHYQMIRMQDLWDLDTAEGTDLDARAADVNPDVIKRSEAVSATGLVQFFRTGSTGAVTIGAGTSVSVPEGSVYVTKVATSIADGDFMSGQVLAVAEVAGDAGNITSAGSLDPTVGIPTESSAFVTAHPTYDSNTDGTEAVGVTKMTTVVSGVDAVKNVTPFTGGGDQESDSSLRERIKSYLRSLSRATAYSIESALLGVALEDHGMIKIVEVKEFPSRLGKVLVYVDDGTGASGSVQNDNYTTSTTIGEEVITSANGGEVMFYLNNKPLVADTPIDLYYKETTSSTPVKLITYSDTPASGVAYDALVNLGTGKITLNVNSPKFVKTSTLPAGLRVGNNLKAQYRWYEGLLAEAQKIVDGDPADRVNYPGYRAAGVDVIVVPPKVYNLSLEAVIKIEAGHSATFVLGECRSAIMEYINALPLNGDVVVTEIIHALQKIPGVYDVIFNEAGIPIVMKNVIVGEGELVRIQSGNITLSGA